MVHEQPDPDCDGRARTFHSRTMIDAREMRMTSPTYIIAAAALLAAAAPAKAQVIDLSLITCKQLLTTEPDRQAFIAWWMSGYFSASKNLNVVDVRYVERN